MNRATAFAALTILAIATSYAQDGATTIEGYFNRYRYTALKPPVAFSNTDQRTKDWLRPGFVFLWEKGKKPRSIGCPSVIQGESVSGSWIAESKASLKRKGSFNLAASLLSPIGGINESASAESGFSWDKNSVIEFTNLTELQPASALTKSEIAALGAGKAATLTALHVDTLCAARIRTHLSEGTPVFLVTSSIEADAVNVRVDQSSGFSAKLDFSIKKLINIRPGVDSKTEGSSSISFSMKDRPIRLAINATRIKMARPIGEVANSGGDQIDVMLSPPEVLSEMDFSDDLPTP